MSEDCDLCGQDISECHCYIHELEERICILEDSLDDLTNVVKAISDYVRKEKKKSDESKFD